MTGTFVKTHLYYQDRVSDHVIFGIYISITVNRTVYRSDVFTTLKKSLCFKVDNLVRDVFFLKILWTSENLYTDMCIHVEGDTRIQH